MSGNNNQNNQNQQPNFTPNDQGLTNLLNEDGYFVVSKKNIKWAIGILTTVLVALWGSLQYSVQQANNKAESTNEAVTALVKQLEEKKVDPLDNKVDNMRVDVGILLDRTNSNVTKTNTNGNMPNVPNQPPPN